MDQDGDRAGAPLEMGSERVEAFSDGVMAVIITILALELRAPAGPTLQELQKEWPSLLIYVLAFTFIAIYWNNHHHLLRATTRISGAVMWANMFLLFCLSLIPVVTEWLRDTFHEPLPAASFGVVCLLAGFAYLLLVRAIIRALARGHGDRLRHQGTRRSRCTSRAWGSLTSRYGSPTRCTRRSRSCGWFPTAGSLAAPG